MFHQFPTSCRVKRLQGMEYEQRGDYTEASKIYKDILEENPANGLAIKRQIAILKAQGQFGDAIRSLNGYLTNFPNDASSWQELANMYLAVNAVKQAAFCYEELILLNPLNFWLHSRLAEMYMTLGGYDRLRDARKHFAKSIDFQQYNIILFSCYTNELNNYLGSGGEI